MSSNNLFAIAEVLFYVFIIGFVIAASISLWVIQKRKEKNRIADLKAFAARSGWQFFDTFSFPFLAELAHYSRKNETGLLGGTTENPLNVSPKNVIQGSWQGRSFAVFEQTFSTGYNRRRYITQTLFALELNDMFLPFFCLEPDSFEHFLSRNFDRLDIDFYTHPDFSRTHLLFGQDENRIRNLFQPKVLNFYEQNPPFTTVAGGKYLVIYEVGRVFSPEQIPDQLGFMFALVNAFRQSK